MFNSGILLAIGVLAVVAVACGGDSTVPAAEQSTIPTPVPELLPARAMYDGYRMVSSYQETVKGGAARFEGMPLFNVIGSDGNIYLHVAATSGADIVCVFAASQKTALDRLVTAQALASMEGIVNGWDGDDLIIDSCTISLSSVRMVGRVSGSAVAAVDDSWGVTLIPGGNLDTFFNIESGRSLVTTFLGASWQLERHSF